MLERRRDRRAGAAREGWLGDGHVLPRRERQAAGVRVDGSYRDVVRAREGVLLLADVKRAPASRWPKNGSASLWDLGDGVLCLEFHTKMNSLDEGVLRMVEKASELIAEPKHERARRRW